MIRQSRPYFRHRSARTRAWPTGVGTTLCLVGRQRTYAQETPDGRASRRTASCGRQTDRSANCRESCAARTQTRLKPLRIRVLAEGFRVLLDAVARFECATSFGAAMSSEAGALPHARCRPTQPLIYRASKARNAPARYCG